MEGKEKEWEMDREKGRGIGSERVREIEMMSYINNQRVYYLIFFVICNIKGVSPVVRTQYKPSIHPLSIWLFTAELNTDKEVILLFEQDDCLSKESKYQLHLIKRITLLKFLFAIYVYQYSPMFESPP